MTSTSQEIDDEITRRVTAIASDPSQVSLYDLDGDGALDPVERDLLHSLLRSELVRGWNGVSDKAGLLRDRYRLVRRVGAGAQGEMHLARDEQEQRFVAVKISSLQSANDWKAVELFEREAQTLQHLKHPNIPRYYDYFVLEEEQSVRLVLVREYVHGVSVEEIIRGRERLSENEVLSLARDVLETFVYLHELSPPVVHRDVKPSNIMRRSDGRHMLADFGAVQARLPGDVGGSTVAGTSGYMPPEQLMGRARPSSDLYALGATLLHLVTGRHPSKLPVVRLRFAWHELAHVDVLTSAFIDRLVEPAIEDRFESAAQALAHLPASRTDLRVDIFLARQKARETGMTATRPRRQAVLRVVGPRESSITFEETEDRFEMRIPNQPNTALSALLAGGLLIAANIIAMLWLDNSWAFLPLLLGGVWLGLYGLGSAYETTVLSIDRDNYRFKRARLTGVVRSEGSVDHLERAEYDQSKDNKSRNLVLRTRLDGNVTVHGYCDEEESKLCAERINQFLDRVKPRSNKPAARNEPQAVTSRRETPA